MSENTRTENDVVAELAAKAAATPEVLIGDIDHLQGVVLPTGTTFQQIDLEKYLPEPARVRGAVTVDDPASLVAYISRFEQEQRGAVYADIDTCTVKAVLNGPADGDTPGWGDHTATLALRKSIEWERWAGRDREYMGQADFAELLEEGIDEIVEPPAADLMELALTFQASTSASFKQGTNLSNGARQLTYEEQIDARAGSTGQVVIPKTFLLRLKPFDGSEAVAVEARLRYRLREGRLTLAFFLDEPRNVIRDSFRTVVNDIVDSTQVNVYYGRRAS